MTNGITNITEVKEVMYNIQADPSYYICMGNSLLVAKQELSINSAKLFRLAVMQIVLKDNDFMTYQISIPELSDILDISSSNLYSTKGGIKSMCTELMSAVVLIESVDDKGAEKWRQHHLVSSCNYNDDVEGMLVIKLHEAMRSHLLGLNENYTQYQGIDIFTMRSAYSIRLFELLRMKLNNPKNLMEKPRIVELSIKEIRTACNIADDKYQDSITMFKKQVVEKALIEINSKTMYRVTYAPIKKAKTFTGFTFVVFHFLDNRLKAIDDGTEKSTKVNAKKLVKKASYEQLVLNV